MCNLCRGSDLRTRAIAAERELQQLKSGLMPAQTVRARGMLAIQAAQRDVFALLETLEWRKRTGDSALECPTCRVLKSAFGGAHPPSCEFGRVKELVRPDPRARRHLLRQTGAGPKEI